MFLRYQCFQLKNKTLIINRLKGFKWSRRESNSGPNKQLKGFLHAYFLFRFSTIG